MEIQIRAKGLPGAAGIRQLAAGRIRAALHSFDDVVESVSVLLVDTNGPDRGGIDKLCRVVMRLRDSSLVIIEELGAEVAGVIERVAGRIRKCVVDQLKWLPRGQPPATPV